MRPSYLRAPRYLTFTTWLTGTNLNPCEAVNSQSSSMIKYYNTQGGWCQSGMCLSCCSHGARQNCSAECLKSRAVKWKSADYFWKPADCFWKSSNSVTCQTATYATCQTHAWCQCIAAPRGWKSGFTQSYSRSYGDIIPVFIEFAHMKRLLGAGLYFQVIYNVVWMV